MSDEKEEFKSTKQVLELIGLSQQEIDTFFHLTGRGPVMIGEIALLVNVDEDRASQIAKNLLEKGLVREVPGKTPFYVALPPYSALLNQIALFKGVVKNIQETTPKALDLKFKEIEEHSAKLGKLNEYRNYIQMMKQNLPAQLKSQFNRVEKELESVKKFQEIRSFILNLREIVPEEIIKEFSIVESRLEKMKAEISDSFEKQFRIGALKSMAEKIVSKIISEQFIDLTEYFREKFVSTIQNTLDQVTNQLATISDAAGEMSTDLSGTLNDIELGLKDTLEDLDTRISTVYEDVDKGIEELKDLFQREIYKILEEDIITNILNQLNLSEETMNEFWERSKKASMLTFKDVWFVRSIEGMKAQVNESISRIKMRVHIIAPRLQDVDLIALSKSKKHINIRISTNFDWNNPDDQLKLQEIVKAPNMDVRLYSRENLWAINRDFEEVVVCVVSKVDNEFEIAGMGSILEEHVKLFAAVLEDVWIQSKKISDQEILYSLGSSSTVKIEKSSPQVSKFIPKHSIESDLATKIEPLQQKPQIESRPSPTPNVKSVAAPTEKPSSKEEGSITTLLSQIMLNLRKKNGTELASDLEALRNKIIDEKGYSSVLNHISMTIATLKILPRPLTQLEIEDTIKKIDFWKSKLHL
ncbi:MAG: hypothetical protein EU531_09435 [Promethearchaeota archaeon]|nr:MAG: hypothetical protein EU531_09435 [Candidatus Lokiarchaeota archaeon]